MPKVTTACAVTAIKYLTHALGPLLGLISPWTLVAVISFVISFYASARSLQLGLAVEVIAVTSVAANLAAILGGVLVFGEPVGSGPLGITAPVYCVLPCHRRRRVHAGSGAGRSPDWGRLWAVWARLRRRSVVRLGCKRAEGRERSKRRTR